MREDEITGNRAFSGAVCALLLWKSRVVIGGRCLCPFAMATAGAAGGSGGDKVDASKVGNLEVRLSYGYPYTGNKRPSSSEDYKVVYDHIAKLRNDVAAVIRTCKRHPTMYTQLSPSVKGVLHDNIQYLLCGGNALLVRVILWEVHVGLETIGEREAAVANAGADYRTAFRKDITKELYSNLGLMGTASDYADRLEIHEQDLPQHLLRVINSQEDTATKAMQIYLALHNRPLLAVVKRSLAVRSIAVRLTSPPASVVRSCVLPRLLLTLNSTVLTLGWCKILRQWQVTCTSTCWTTPYPLQR